MYRVNRFSPLYTAIYCAAFVRSLCESSSSFSGNALCHLRYETGHSQDAGENGWKSRGKPPFGVLK